MSSYLECPDCGKNMIKTAIQLEDLSGWIVGWTCECLHDEENVELHIHAGKDWTAAVLHGEG